MSRNSQIRPVTCWDSYEPNCGPDEGHDYHGPDEIRAWLARSASEYTYTIELTTAARADDQHFDAVHHLEGSFPGGAVDLHFRFTLRGALISRLVIEP